MKMGNAHFKKPVNLVKYNANSLLKLPPYFVFIFSKLLTSRYSTIYGGVRIGRLLEDMDVFAVHLGLYSFLDKVCIRGLRLQGQLNKKAY